MLDTTKKAWMEGQRLTRKERKQLGRAISTGSLGLEVVHADAAGIDIGCREHYVAVGPERDTEPVRNFGCFTAELRRNFQKQFPLHAAPSSKR